MEKVACGQHLYAFAAYGHERPHGKCKGRCQLGLGQGEGVFAGDTLYAESTVLSKRESKSRPSQGIVTVLTRGVNQDGVEVMSFERTMLIYKRGHSPEADANY